MVLRQNSQWAGIGATDVMKSKAPPEEMASWVVVGQGVETGPCPGVEAVGAARVAAGAGPCPGVEAVGAARVAAGAAGTGRGQVLVLGRVPQVLRG